MIELIGYAAAFLTTASFVPQAIKTLKTQDTAGISFWMYLMFVAGVTFWMIYGFLLDNLIIAIDNAITVILAGAVLWVKAKNILTKKESQ